MSDFVPVSVMDVILSETFGAALSRHGFEQAGRRKWVRGDGCPIRALFEMIPMKGACYSPCWGFSLDFVPHVSGSSIRWHRTAKSAVFDLCYDPVDYTTDSDEWDVPRLYGRDVAYQFAHEKTEKALAIAVPWFTSVVTLADLAREFEAKKDRPFVRFGFYNYVQEPLAFAFVLAKTGRPMEAIGELERFFEYGLCDESLKDRLLRLLKSTPSENMC